MGVREKISKLVEQGNSRETIGYINEWLINNTNISKYSLIAKLIEQNSHQSLQRLRVGYLSSFTHQTMKIFMDVEAYLNEIILENYFSNYNQWRQELIVENSGLDLFKPDVILLMVDMDDLSQKLSRLYFTLEEEDIQKEIDHVIREVSQCIRTYRQRSATPIIVFNFLIPPLLISNTFDWSAITGMRSMMFQLNQKFALELNSIADVAILDYDDVASRYGKERWLDSKLYHTVKTPINLKAMPVLASEIIKFIKAIRYPKIKCIVTDLDNTLWGGVIGEDGMAGIKLGPEYPGSAYVKFQETLLQMRSIGIILAINSRNNLDDVMEVFEKHPHSVLTMAHFTAHRINWKDKATNLKELAEEINIGLDSIMFIDDNVAECERVISCYPEIKVVHMQGNPLDFPQLVLKEGVFFSHKLSGEDRRRCNMYGHQKKVREAAVEAISYTEFIRGLQMELTIENVNQSSISRIAQLTQKTNQFNLTTKRYTETDISNIISENKLYHIFQVKLKDKYGEYGIIGVLIINVELDKWIIDTFLMSCRVIGRGVEYSIISFIKNYSAQKNAELLIGLYRPTKKNMLVNDLYDKHGFVLTDKNEYQSKYELVPAEVKYPDTIKVAVCLKEK